jgi:DNA polymerase III sliding clamp (beta) subunit (PCNA family)
MKINISMTEYKHVISGLSKVGETSKKNRIFSPVVITADESGVTFLRVNFYGSSAAIYSANTAIATEYGRAVFTLDAAKLTAKQKAKDITIESDGEKSQAFIDGVTIPLDGYEKDEEIMALPFFSEDAPYQESDNFLAGYRRCLTCVSTDQSRISLQGVYVDNNGALVSTDGRRLMVQNCDIATDCEEFKGPIIPPSDFLAWEKLAGPCGVAFEKNQAFFIVGDWSFSIKTIDASFPNYKQVIPHYQEADREPLRIAPDDVVRLLPFYSARKDAKFSRVVLDGTGGGVVATMGTMTAALPASEYKGRIGLDVGFLFDFIDCGFLEFSADNKDGSRNPIVGINLTGTAVLMPIKIDDVPAQDARKEGAA